MTQTINEMRLNIGLDISVEIGEWDVKKAEEFRAKLACEVSKTIAQFFNDNVKDEETDYVWMEDILARIEVSLLNIPEAFSHEMDVFRAKEKAKKVRKGKK